MKPAYTPTQLSMFFRCGMQFEHRYVREIMTPPRGVTLAKQSAMTSITASYERKRDTGSPLGEEELQDLATDAATAALEACDGEIVEDLDPDGGKPQSVPERARGMARAHARNLMPNVKPSGVLRPYRLALAGSPVDLTGVIECEEKDSLSYTAETNGASVIMHRASIRKNELHDVQFDLSLTAAHLAVTLLDGVAPQFTILHGLAPARCSVADEPLDIPDHERLLLRVGSMAETVQAGRFLPAPPGAWYCTADQCGYWDVCPYGRRGKEKATI